MGNRSVEKSQGSNTRLMETAGNILSVLFLGVMSWQDFKTRTITAWVLPAIGLCFLLGEISVLSPDILLYNAWVNWTLLVLQFFLLWLWISARSRKWVNIVDTQVGLGDILLLVCLAPAFSPINFFVFYTAGAVFAIGVAIMSRRFISQDDQRIPLAGLLGLPLMMICSMRLFNLTLPDLTKDDWIAGMLNSVTI